MIYAKIAGTGSYLPRRIMSNHDIAETVDTDDEWIVQRTGIMTRHIAADDETASFMATQAAKQALEAAGLAASEVGLVVVATCTPDYVFPSTASLVQAAIGAPHCAAFDVSAACSGFSHALSVAQKFIETGSMKHALVIGSEMMSRVIDWKDRRTCILFGDGAGAVLLSASDEPGILSTHLHSDGTQHDILYVPSLRFPQHKSDQPCPAFMQMQGNDVFKFAVTALTDIIHETLAANGLKGQDIDWFIPHQANLRIIAALAKKMQITLDKVIITIAEQANTSAASIPLALDLGIRDGRIKRGDLLLLESFGGGIAWGSALIRY